eukprot:1317965-Rhodomonas_salina.2
MRWPGLTWATQDRALPRDEAVAVSEGGGAGKTPPIVPRVPPYRATHPPCHAPVVMMNVWRLPGVLRYSEGCVSGDRQAQGSLQSAVHPQFDGRG